MKIEKGGRWREAVDHEGQALGRARLQTPTPGRETVRYGGDTYCCIEHLRLNNTLIILDCGSNEGMGKS